ncbi:MAG: hypothetical protein M9965_04085 [Anaerolineae bacterium]|nr:hypothetical protein [Anaerolineae bacterium]
MSNAVTAPPRSSFTDSGKRPRRDWLALFAITLLAAVLRFWNLDGMPPGFYHDEAYNGLDALALAQGREFPLFYEGWELYSAEAHAENAPIVTRFPIFFEGNYGREPLHIYLMAVSVKLFGATPWAIRAVPAVAGVLAVVTTFFAADALLAGIDDRLRRFAPLFAAFALAILFPAIHFSRFGLRAMLFVPVETLAVYCFWRGMRKVDSSREDGQYETKGTWAVTGWFVAGGLLLGFGLYIYAAARLFPLVFAGYALVWFWRDRAALRQYGTAFLALGGAAIVVAMPLLLYFARYPYFFVFRTAYVANRGLGAVEGQPLLTWLNNIGRIVRGFFWQGETHLRHNLPGRPYLDALQALFFITGMAATATKKSLRRQHQGLFLFLWLTVMLLATILSGDAPHFGRMTGAAPAVTIVIGVGAVWVLDKLTPRLGSWALVLIVSLFLVSTVWTTFDYFGRYASHPQIEADFYLADWELGQHAANYSADTTLFLSPNQEEMATIYFALNGDADRLHTFDGFHDLIPFGPGDTVYFVRRDDMTTLSHVMALFPDATVTEADDNTIIVSVSAESNRPTPSQPIDHAFGDAISLRGYDVTAESDALAVTLYWQANRPVTTAYTAFVHALDREGNLVAQLDRPPLGYPTSDWRPGETIIDTYRIEGAANGMALRTGFYDSADLQPLGTAADLTLP